MKNLPLHRLQYLAKLQRLAQAWIISGQSEAAPLELVQQFSQWLFCSNPINEQACGHCKSCRLFTNQNHPDYHKIPAELESIRDLATFLVGQPQIANYKIVVITEVDKLNNFAANALLKNLEEPGPNKLIFLLVKHPALLLNTILSRCQLINLKNEGQAVGELDQDIYNLFVAKKLSAQQLIEKLRKYPSLEMLYWLELGVANLLKTDVQQAKLWEILDGVWQARRWLFQKQNPNIELLLEKLILT